VPKLFGVTLFVSATLLFLVQPMVGKMILPLLGGTPAVWNTCMVFFQALLLAGYYYAHATSTRLPTRRQVAVHTGLLVASAAVLGIGAALVPNHSPVPVVKSLAPQGSSVPFFGVMALLAAAIGLPFFTVSTTAPLLQKWFSETGHPSAKDPYFLYAASNFGSLLALLAYPFVVEPNLRLVEQAWVWAAGFVVLIVLIVLCGNAVKNVPPPRPAATARGVVPAAPAPSWATKLRWLLLAAVPSSLMLATTTDVTTDIVSMPLLWIVPLALYLLTFVIVFSKTVPAVFHLYVTLMTPVVVLLMVFLRMSADVPDSELKVSFKLTVGLELLAFFMVALTCHGELARTRPSTEYLTQFYLIMSFGGMLGGLFNALVAPLVFTFITEYPLSLVAACFLLPPIRTLLNPGAGDRPGAGGRLGGFGRVAFWDVLMVVMFLGVSHILSNSYDVVRQMCGRVVRSVGSDVPSNTVATVVVFGLPTLICYFLVERPVRFGMCVAALWLGAFWTFAANEWKVPPEYRTYYTRSFFGHMKVELTTVEPPYDRDTGMVFPPPSHPFRRLVHGTTVHGSQAYEPAAMSDSAALWLLGANGPADALALAWIAQPNLEFPHRDPVTYYHRSGPVGEVFNVFWDATAAGRIRTSDAACVGLGTGSSSAYGRPGQRFTFFEIDQTVARLVREPRYFSFVTEAERQGVKLEFVMGDARLSLEQTDHTWGILLVDAFSSDSIPAHLLTTEAVQLYFNRLDANGLLALHISNRYLRLEPVVDRIVRELGYDALVMHDFVLADSLPYPDDLRKPEYSGKYSSSWVVVGRTKEALAPFHARPEKWVPLKGDDAVGLWTDDYTPIKNVLQGDWAFIRIFSE
jgi:hypothetical protein